MARPQEEQKRTLSEDATPQPEQVIMQTDCIARRPRRRSLPSAAVKHVVSPFGFAEAVILGGLHDWRNRLSQNHFKRFLGSYALFNPVQPASYAGQNWFVCNRGLAFHCVGVKKEVGKVKVIE
jgi:hypothetical protein